MGVLERFLAYATDFEATYKDDDWSRLEAHFHKDVVYSVSNIYFGCRIEGVGPMLQGLRKSIDGFDRHSLSRTIEVTDGPEVEGDTATLGWVVHYSFAGDVPDFDLIGRSSATVVDDRIVDLRDRYADGVSDAAEVFMREWLPGVDPNYL
jgi:hypothetical protein